MVRLCEIDWRASDRTAAPLDRVPGNRGSRRSVAYGVDQDEMFVRAAVFVAKILKGAKPAELPVEQPTRFKFVIHLKAANALGLTMPYMLSGRADEVIE